MATSARRLAAKPQALGFTEAAALPLAGLTAWQMLVELGHVGPGMRVFVNGAAGGVGHLAVQVAKARGARVVATARAAKHGFLRDLGADELIDPATVDVAQAVRGADLVIELVGGSTCLAMLKTLRPGGLLISAQAAWAPALHEEAECLGVRASGFLVEPDGVGLEALAALVQAGLLRVHVSQTFALPDAARAQQRVAARDAMGKVVLQVSEAP